MSQFLHDEISMKEAEEDLLAFEEELYARAIGREIMNWAKSHDLHLLGQQADRDALLLLKEIQSILNDDTLDDPECFYRIDAIVSAFHRVGLSTDRHWDVD